MRDWLKKRREPADNNVEGFELAESGLAINFARSSGKDKDFKRILVAK
jgi:hypothetical protein